MVLVGLLLVAKLVLLSHCKGEKERERNGNHKGGVCFLEQDFWLLINDNEWMETLGKIYARMMLNAFMLLRNFSLNFPCK